MKHVISLILALTTLNSFIIAEQSKWSWNTPHATVSAKGDLTWKPEPYRFETSGQVRYIDYEAGKDNNPGTKAAPWKHHPWDTKATGKSKAQTNAFTAVFKGGVTYRGTLLANGSGTAASPYRLTRDPNWGKGPAQFVGSEHITQWAKGSKHKDIPDGKEVWVANIDFLPRNVWIVKQDGAIQRLPLARTPNWTIKNYDDIKSEWYEWNNPVGKHFGHKANRRHVAYDTKNITKPASYYTGAKVWTEWGWVMGTPYPATVDKVDVKKKALHFGGIWGGPSGVIIKGNRYFLEDKPHYLDDPNGEFWLEKKGNGGVLYVRLPKGETPKTVRVEAAKHNQLIYSEGMNHVAISGLTFRFTNVTWQYWATLAMNPNTNTAALRLSGSGNNLRVNHCTFEHVSMPIYFRPKTPSDAIDQVRIHDNVMRYTDFGALYLIDGGGWGKKEEKIGRLYDVKVLRNKCEYVGMRPSRYGQGHAMEVNCAETVEIAGNILDRTWAAGIFVYGSKQSRLQADRPLSRILIHHNKVTNSMLNTNDWGGIETWQGGPAYVYNNISGNPGGYWHWKYVNHRKEPGFGRFGHAYYLDGAYKNYYFNNIAWGKSKDPLSPLANTAAFQEIHSFENAIFNNTAYNFVVGSRRQTPHAGRGKYLSNIFDGIGMRVFRHHDPAKANAQANADHAGKQRHHFAYETNAFEDNIFHDVANYGVYNANGQRNTSLEDFKNDLKKHKSLGVGLGEETATPPLRDAKNHDFRLSSQSAAKDKGAKVFAPWSLFRNVGEWHFYHAGNDITRIIDEHWYMAPYYADRKEYGDLPKFGLTAVNITKDSYIKGPLENWTNGALTLNGKDQYLTIAHEKLLNKKIGEGFMSPNIKNTSFIIETYLQVNTGHTGGTIVQKLAKAGFRLGIANNGALECTLKGNIGSASFTGTTPINDGKWHHILWEVNNESGSMNLYLDGKLADTAKAPKGVSYENAQALFVGGSPQDGHLNGTFEFLRISQGTLKQAKTTIEELYAWQFDGPFLRDFTGQAPVGQRDAGALELR